MVTTDQSEQTAPQLHAAMYVRMSTDHQKYSTENQIAAMEEYAKKHNIEIVTSYIDGGESGLDIKWRKALKQLIHDVTNDTVNFQAILVYDVSRWGRFQNSDAGAYYEYSCYMKGIRIHYVAEQFENDGSFMSGTIKNLKRGMAGEYSRELSVKVHAGQCRLIGLGFRQGGSAGYGLRRMMIDEQRQPKMALKHGERKSLQTDRVILVPGPQDEIDTVRLMYQSFVDQCMTESQIAALLNQRGIKTDFDRPWTRATVHQVLTNEKYIGNNVFNRRSFRLKLVRVNNPPDKWVRAESAFKGIIEPAYFFAAQHLILERSRRLSNDDMLAKLKELHDRKGWLSGILIDEEEGMPSSSAYAHRFGGLVSAYKLVGYEPDIDYSYQEINKNLRKLYPEIAEGTIKRIQETGGRVRREVETDLLIVNDELTVSIVISRCQFTKTGSLRWNIRLDTGLRPDFTIAVRMDHENKEPLDYYILPAIDVENPNLRLAQDNSFSLDTYRFDDLEPFFRLTKRVALPEVA